MVQNAYLTVGFGLSKQLSDKHFEIFDQQVYDNPKTVVSEEYSTEYQNGMEPYYHVNDATFDKSKIAIIVNSDEILYRLTELKNDIFKFLHLDPIDEARWKRERSKFLKEAKGTY